MRNEIFTVGHSTQPVEQFVRLLRTYGITTIADVRSTPYSRHNSQFNREDLRGVLKGHDIKYVFLGKELGARTADERCYRDDKVQYALLAKTTQFQSGIARVIEGAATYKIAMMCAEKDPLDCHRTILVARALVRQGCTVTHILANGSRESHQEAMSRLVVRMGLADDLFRSQELTIEEAYEKQGNRIAYDRRIHRAAEVDGDEFRESEG